MVRRLFILAVLLSSLTTAIIGQPADGILITQRVTSGGAPLTIQLQIQAARMRTETAGPDGITNVTIMQSKAYPTNCHAARAQAYRLCLAQP